MAEDLSSFGEDLSGFGAPLGQKEDLSSFGEDLSSFGAPITAKPVAPSGPGARALPVAPGLLAEPSSPEPQDYDELGMFGRRAADFERGLTGMEAGGAATRVMYGMEEADVDSAFDLIDQGKVDEAFELAGSTRVNAVLAYRDATPEQRAELRAQRAENTDLPGQIAELMEVNKRYNALPNNPRMAQMAEAGNAKDYGKAVDIFLSDPFGIIASVGTESAPAMAAGMAASVATANPAVGMGMGSAWVEQASAVQQGIDEAVRAAGGDPANPEDVQRILSDPKVRAAISNNADLRAGIIGLVDAASGGLASKTMGVGQGVTKELTNVAVQMPVQGVMGAAGEGAAEYATTGEVKPGNMALEFLGEAVTAPADIAVAALSGAKKSPETSLTPDPKPMGPLQGSRQPAPLTPSDVRSPIPTDLVQQGKNIVAQALAQSDANKILSAAGFPQIGARVTLSYPDGRKNSGSVVDAFSATSNETGATDNGIKIKLDDGTVFEEFEATIRQAGLLIENAGKPTVTGAPGVSSGMVDVTAATQGLDTTAVTDLNVPRETDTATPLEGQDVGGETVQQVPGAPAATAPAVLPGVPDASAAGQPSAPPSGLGGVPSAPAGAEAEGDGTRVAPLKPQVGTDVDGKADVVNAEPSPAQVEAGNYQKLHLKVHGLDISVETPKGGIRRSKLGAPKWEVTMPAHYGYIKRTEGADGEQIDVTVGPNTQSVRTFIVDQIDPTTGKFDEHKVFLGFDSQEQAIAAYDASFSDGSGPSRRGAVVAGTTVNFKRWLNNADTTKPLAYKGKTAAGLQGSATAADQGGIPLPTEETNAVDQVSQPRPVSEAQAGQGRQEGEKGPEVRASEGQGTGAAGVRPPNLIDQLVDEIAEVDRTQGREAATKRYNELVQQHKLKVFEGVVLQDRLRKKIEPKPMDALKAKVEEKRKPKTPQVDALPGMTPLGAKPAQQKTPGDIRDDERGVNGAEGFRETDKIASIQGRTIGPSVIHALWYREGVGGRVLMAKVRENDTGKFLVVPAMTLEKATPEPAKAPPKAEPAPAAPQAEKPAKPAYGATNKLVSQDRAAELRERLKAKFKDLKNLPKDEQGALDPEMLALGTELAVFHIEAGSRKFAAFAKAMAEDLGQSLADLRPYLRGWYNAARDMMEDRGGDVNDMDTPEQVKAALVSVMENEAASANVKSNEPDRRTETEDVGAPGVGEAGAGVAAGQPGGKPRAGNLEDQPAKDDGGARGGGVEGPGARADRPQAEGAASIREGGDAADGRGGASGAGVEPAGAGGRGVPAGGRPNYFVGDPERLIGGTPKVRFARNKKAIEAFRSITEENRDPTKEELDAVAGYIGWGSFGQELFQGTWARPMPKDGWAEESKWMREHLGQQEWESAQSSIINAHYTDPPTVLTMWDMVRKMGFTGGRVLEPSMGIGNFFGMMPRDLEGASELTGIEMDSLTGGMAKLLYPQANVSIKPYQDSKTADNFYDLVIGNWPFAKDGPSDRRYDKLGASLHDYFFVKALDQVRPGGLVVGITSAGTMDKMGRPVRLHLAKNAELVAAFRLPTGAFKEYAGTSVVTDIIILKKREKPDTKPQDWTETVKQSLRGNEINLNKYWLKNRDNILGQLDFGSGSTYGRPSMIVNRPADFMQRLKSLPGRVPEGIYSPVKRGNEPRFVSNNTKDRQGAITIQDNKLYVVQGDRLAPLDDVIAPPKDKAAAKKRETQVRGLVAMRLAYGGLIDAERDGAATTEELRAILKKLYDGFRKSYGPINDSDGLSVMRRLEDPFHAVVAALENPDGSPAAILSRATTRSKKKLDKPTVRDAFVLARNEGIVVDMASIAAKAGATQEAVAKELLDSKAVYRTPGGGFEVADVYLSGNIRRKMREAVDAKERGEDMDGSIEALKGVMPKDVPYFQIEAKLGATWVGNDAYRQFFAELLGVKVSDEITVEFKVGAWKVRFGGNLNSRPEATTTWGHEDVTFHKLASAAMNSQSITIKRKTDDGDIVDEAATKAVNEKATRIREEFSAWAWRDVERRVEFEKNYNEIMNAIAVPKYDGSFLELSGMALTKGDKPFNLREHQTNAIWRGIVSGAGIYAHEVGTGKTYTMGGIAVESRRYGVARKPLIFAHNANSASVAREIQEMYPGAKVLYIDNLTPETIDVTMRRIANDEWDAVVVPHSLIDRFALSEKTLNEIAAEEIAALEQEAMEAASEEGGKLDLKDMDDEKAMKKLRSPTAKQLVHQRNKIKESIKKMAARASAEGAIAFEDLGVDLIEVDEAHVFKKPPIATKMRLKGLNTATSNRSIALRFLTDYVKRINNGKGVHVFTGTPITNTLTEIYNMMRFAMDHVMAKDGIKEWDAWFNTFADSSTDVELTPTGEYDAVTRLAAFVNVAELRRMAGEFMDIVFADDMPEFKPRSINGKTLADELTAKEREQLESGRSEDPEGRPYKKIVTDVGPLSPDQKAALDTLVDLARLFKNATKKERREMMLSGHEASPLKVENNATKAGLDVRLYKDGAEDHPQSKANRAVKNILKIYNEHAQTTQVLFMEIGYSDSAMRSTGTKDADGNTIKKKVSTFNLAKDIVDKLVAGGIPRDQIAIVDGSVSKGKRKQIADKMNANEIRVVLGNSSTLGVGVNMQTNLRAMHHLDAPWMPGDLEQRNGRGWRQGNKWNTVLEYRYITEKLDGRRWQVLTIKDRFIKAFMKADESVRIIDGDAVSLEEGESANDLADTLAQAAGDPRLLIKNKLANDIKKLEGRERLHTFGIKDAKDQVKSIEKGIEFRTERAGKLEQDAAAYEKAKEAGFTATIAGQTFTERADAGKALNEFVVNMKHGVKQKLAEIQGFPLMANFTQGTQPDYWLASLETKLEYDVSPSIASVESKLRNIAGAAEKMRQENEDARGSIKRMEEAQQQPFAQADLLESKREKYKALLNDLNASPIPPPDWLRHGAPVGSEVQVKFERYGFDTVTVEGHRWGDDNYYVIVDHEGKSREVPYLEVHRDFNPAYDPHPFEAPPKKEAAPPAAPPQSKAQKARRGVGAGSPELGGLIELLNDRMRALGIADEVRLRVTGALGVQGRYTSLTRLIEVSVPDSLDQYGTLNHEAIHAMRDLNLFTQAEWNVLEAAARKSPLFKVQRELYSELSDESVVEETIAEMFRKYATRAGYGPMTIRGLLERISHFIQAVREWFAETGYSRAQDIFGRVESGEVGRRDRLMEETWLDEDPDLIGPDPGELALNFQRSKAQKPPRPRGASDKLSIDNAETNRRVQDAFKGIDNGEGRVAKMKEWLADKWHGFSRHYRNLPDTAEYADVGQQLRKLEASPGAAKERIVRILREITEGMNEDDLKLFAWKVALDDLSWEVTQDHQLPFGLTPETLTDEKAKVDAVLASRPDLTWAVRQRKLLIRDVANSLIKAGVLHRDQVKNPAYYRHQVLDYARAVTHPSGTGKKLRTPYWAKRQGSTLDINLNLLEAEFDWLHKAMVSVDTVKTIDWIKKSEHNVRGQVVAAAKAHNDAQIKALIDAEGDGGPLHDQWTKFRQRIAMGLAKVKKAIEDGDLYVPEEWEDAAGNLTGDRANDANIFPFLAWIMDNDDAGAAGAAQTFKAIAERRDWVKSMLGPKYADPLNVGELVSRFAPEGYVSWQPDSPDGKGNALRLYVSKAIPEQALQRMMEKALDGVTLPAEFSERIKRDVQNELKSALTVGASKYEMVIPQELADTLNNLRNEFEENVIASLIEKPTRLWKLWTLFNPRRVLKYNINNLSGDLDAVIAGNPHIMKRVPKAARELFNVMAKKGKPTERYMEAIERGVFDSGFTLQEIPDINYLSDFEHLTKPMNWKNPLAVTKEAARRGWAFTRGATTWRENVFRYAAYLDYVEQLESGKTPEQIGYGATRPEIVDAVGSKKDQAALMARDLIGDYGAISAFGQQLRRYVIPFWSFQEINLRRYWRLNANAWKQGVVKGAKTSAVTGAALGLRTTLWLYIRMFAVYGAINIWNYLMFDDEEDDLDPEERARLHLNLGKWNGELVTMRLNGSLSDIMSWFGFSDALAAMYEVEKGRADVWDILGTIAKAPVNKIVNGITPVIKTPLESAAGQTLYPDVFDARPIRDNWRNLAKSFSLEHEYDVLTDSPSRGYLKSWVEGVVSARDPGESAYNRIRFMVTDWEKRVKGEEPYGGEGTPRSNAYYKLRTALKYGDKVAEADARKELDKLGAKADDLKDMFKRAHPLGGLAKKDRPAFMQSLSSEERRVLGIAERWYDDVFR